MLIASNQERIRENAVPGMARRLWISDFQLGIWRPRNAEEMRGYE